MFDANIGLSYSTIPSFYAGDDDQHFTAGQWYCLVFLGGKHAVHEDNLSAVREAAERKDVEAVKALVSWQYWE